MNEEQNLEQNPTISIDNFVDTEAAVETKPFVVSEELQKAIDTTLKTIEDRSFSGRHPELGKMIKCLVCGLRHRSAIKCVQRFKELHIEEDLETGEKTTVYATAAQNTRKGVLGAAAFAKKRFHPHLSRKKLLFVERVRQLFGEGTFDPESPEYQKALEHARKLALRQLRREARQLAKQYRSQQHLSRRINRGLASSGSR